MLTISHITTSFVLHHHLRDVGFFVRSQEVSYVYPCLCYMFIMQLCLTGVPDNSEEDLLVARALNLRWTTVLKENEDGTQTLIHSDQVSAV